LLPDWRSDIETALADFTVVADLARFPLSVQDLECEYCAAPHRPPSRLPAGKMAVYGFWGHGSWLKIGKAGAKTQARYTSQHYNPESAPSTLAASLSRDNRMKSLADFNPDRPGEWIKTSTHRINILLDVKHGTVLLSLLESFLHARLRPRYEGRANEF
jgi:hypothetical protein